MADKREPTNGGLPSCESRTSRSCLIFTLCALHVKTHCPSTSVGCIPRWSELRSLRLQDKTCMSLSLVLSLTLVLYTRTRTFSCRIRFCRL